MQGKNKTARKSLYVTKRFLSLEEIGAIAIHYNKKITFYTKFDNELVKTISHGSDQNPEICMSFDHEKRHFSKMLKKTLGQELKETPAHFQVQIKTDEEREQEDFALACQFASEFNLENSGPQNILKTDHEAAESLQRAFDEEEKNKKAQEEADVAYARFLEAESNVDSLPIDVSLEAQESNFSLKREDFYDFYDWSIRNKQPYFFHLAILHYSCSLRRGEEIPLNLKNVLIKSPEYQKSLTFAVNEYGLIPKFIFQSREWKEAYLQHLMSGRSLSKEDLHVIEQLNKRKNIQKFFDNNNINNRRSLNLALIGWIQRFKKKEKIPLNLNEALKKLESQGLINYRKKILQSNEWKEAYTKHLMKEYDLSENDLSVLDEVSS